MRNRRLAVVLAIALVMTGTFLKAPAWSSPDEVYTETHFGDGNLPPGCVKDMSWFNPQNVCYHMRTDMNGLDSPQVDVLVLVPASPTAERDMRIMRQAVEMWEGGIDYLSPQMGLDWLSTGVDFHITVDAIDLTDSSKGGEFTTYPIVDPEIVIIASNPVGGIGIGIDPVDFVFQNEDQVPCLNVGNPFDFEYWENLPGFDRHHDKREGIYNEDCGGSGGNICFAINGAIDPVPDRFDIFGLFDLVSHEFGHCMTIGHVGDGAEGRWGKVPTNDIMAYSSDPPGRTKCMSSLDVEGVALRMSKYLDVNGDGAVNNADLLKANDGVGDRRNPFQVQHPRDHLYASDTGSPTRCPQPDLGLLPGPRTDWTPTPTQTQQAVLNVTSPTEGASSSTGSFDVTGTVERVPFDNNGPAPQSTGWSSPLAGANATTYGFEHPDGNTFYPEDSSLGMSNLTGRDGSHRFQFDVPETSDVELKLTWTDSTGNTDLDLYASGGFDEQKAASSNRPEILQLNDVSGPVDLRVDPYLITESALVQIGYEPKRSGSTYTLTATIKSADSNVDSDGDGLNDPDDQCPNEPGPAPSGCPDSDGDGVPDSADVCPDQPGSGSDGCPIQATEKVRLFVDDVLVSTQDVDTSNGPDSFAFTAQMTPGSHHLRVEWANSRKTLATQTLTVYAG